MLRLAHDTEPSSIIVVYLINLGLESELNESLTLRFLLLLALEHDDLASRSLQLLLCVELALELFAGFLVLIPLGLYHPELLSDLLLEFACLILVLKLLLEAEIGVFVELGEEVVTVG